MAGVVLNVFFLSRLVGRWVAKFSTLRSEKLLLPVDEVSESSVKLLTFRGFGFREKLEFCLGKVSIFSNLKNIIKKLFVEILIFRE